MPSGSRQDDERRQGVRRHDQPSVCGQVPCQLECGGARVDRERGLRRDVGESCGGDRLLGRERPGGAQPEIDALAGSRARRSRRRAPGGGDACEASAWMSRRIVICDTERSRASSATEPKPCARTCSTMRRRRASACVVPTVVCCKSHTPCEKVYTTQASVGPDRGIVSPSETVVESSRRFVLGTSGVDALHAVPVEQFEPLPVTPAFLGSTDRRESCSSRISTRR